MKLKVISVAILTVLLAAIMFSQEYKIKLTVVDSKVPVPEQYTATFGWHVDATHCMDVALGESDGPPNPPGFSIAFAKFRSTGLADSCYPGGSGMVDGNLKPFDLRMWTLGQAIRDTFRLAFTEPGAATFPITVSWETISEPSIPSLTMKEFGTADLQTVNMLTETSMIITDADIVRLNIFTQTLLNVQEIGGLPNDFKLEQNYPNPFNPSTDVLFSIKNTSNVKISVYNVIGQLVNTLVDEQMNAGNYSVKWDATNYANGVYYIKMNTVNQNGELFNSVKKSVLIK
ncbi:MAG: T9SS type A sorting domain-containing protein [Bacteroidota bacterium]|nr:T9SS type A sorting domain-containing protein [Bacteroidota bacterium]